MTNADAAWPDLAGRLIDDTNGRRHVQRISVRRNSTTGPDSGTTAENSISIFRPISSLSNPVANLIIPQQNRTGIEDW